MKLYWIIIFVGIVIQLFPSRCAKINQFKLFASFFLLFIYAALRSNGFDYIPYEDAYYEIQNFYGHIGFESRMEKGYVLLNYILPSHRLLLVLLSGFTCFTYYWLFRKYVPLRFYWLGFILLALSSDKMFLFQISGLRNAIAINIMTLSIPFIIKRNIKTYLGLTVLAYFFHNSVIFFMPLAYFVATPSNITTKYLLIWASFFAFFILVPSHLLIDYVSSFINIYFERYLDYTQLAEENVYDRSILMYIFVLIVLTISFRMLSNSKLSPEENVLVKLTLLYFISLVLGTLNLRMSQYFAPYLIVSCFVYLKHIPNPFLKYTYLGIVCLFLWYSFFIVYMGYPETASYNYKTIFE